MEAFLRQIERKATSDEGQTPMTRTNGTSHATSPKTPNTLFNQQSGSLHPTNAAKDAWGVQTHMHGGPVQPLSIEQLGVERWETVQNDEWLRNLATIDIE